MSWPMHGAGDEVKMGTRGSFSEGRYFLKPRVSSIVIK